MARLSGIYTIISTPRKQQTKVGLQKNQENAAESAVLVKEMLIYDLVSLLDIYGSMIYAPRFHAGRSNTRASGRWLDL
jgi:hypothetical protein